MDRPLQAVGRQVLKSSCQERGESRRGHFAATHREFAVAGYTIASDVTVNGYVVGWVGENQAGFSAIKQRVIGNSVERISAQQTMRTKLPEVIKA